MFRVSTTPIIRVHKTVTTASNTGHIFCAAVAKLVAKLAWPHWREAAAQKI